MLEKVLGIWAFFRDRVRLTAQATGARYEMRKFNPGTGRMEPSDSDAQIRLTLEATNRGRQPVTISSARLVIKSSEVCGLRELGSGDHWGNVRLEAHDRGSWGLAGGTTDPHLLQVLAENKSKRKARVLLETGVGRKRSRKFTMREQVRP